MRDTGGKVTLAIHALPKPVIAAINGAAVGIGATMTLAMDIRMASTKARIGFVFGRLGIVPEAASSWFLPRIVGIQQALEWVYSADILDADAALAGRLVRSVHEPDELLPAAQELARSFVVGRSPAALGLAKRLLYRNSAAARGDHQPFVRQPSVRQPSVRLQAHLSLTNVSCGSTARSAATSPAPPTYRVRR